MQYYYQSFGKEIGPVDLETVKKAGITPDTLVWREGMANWQKARELPELAELFWPPNMSAAYPPRPVYQLSPSAYLIWAILSTILCFPPFGIVAIIFAARAEGAYSHDNIEGALRYSKEAKKWTIISAATTILFLVLAVIFSLITALLSASGYM